MAEHQQLAIICVLTALSGCPTTPATVPAESPNCFLSGYCSAAHQTSGTGLPHTKFGPTSKSACQGPVDSDAWFAGEMLATEPYAAPDLGLPTYLCSSNTSGSGGKNCLQSAYCDTISHSWELGLPHSKSGPTTLRQCSSGPEQSAWRAGVKLSAEPYALPHMPIPIALCR